MPGQGFTIPDDTVIRDLGTVIAFAFSNNSRDTGFSRTGPRRTHTLCLVVIKAGIRAHADRGKGKRLDPAVKDRCNPPPHRNGLALVVRIFQAADHGGRGAGEFGQLRLGQARFRAECPDIAPRFRRSHGIQRETSTVPDGLGRTGDGGFRVRRWSASSASS